MTTAEHRKGTIELYTHQVESAGPFMKAVLKEAIRKLQKTDINPARIERWVIRLEKNWNKI